MEFKDYYKILGVSVDATQEEIKLQHRKLARKYHSDLHSNCSEEEKREMDRILAEINNARDVLIDPIKRCEYDKMYWEHARQEEVKEKQRRQYERENNRRQERNRRQREQRYNRGYQSAYGYDSYTTANSEDEYVSFVEYLKQAYNEIREEEKKYPFSERHKNITKRFRNEMRKQGKTPKNIPEEILFTTKFGIIHVSSEVFYQLLKFGKIKEDTVPKYVIRNRKSLAAIILTMTIAANGIGGFGAGQTTIAADDNTAASSVTTEASDYTSGNVTDDAENDTITLNRVHEIVVGDTLSELAEDAGISTDELKKINDITSNNIFMGDIINIPYKINNDDLQYFISSISVDNRSLAEIALECETDEATIYNLNQESIQKIDGAYVILSDTLIVPKFSPVYEVHEAKSYNK